MQHHVHPAPRNLPHMRSVTAAQHHHIAMQAHMAPPPLPPQTQHQALRHHLSGNTAAPTVATQSITQPGHSARMSHTQHVHTQQLPTTANQMQKIRQQNQHLNTSNNNNSSSNNHNHSSSGKHQYNHHHNHNNNNQQQHRNVIYAHAHAQQQPTSGALPQQHLPQQPHILPPHMSSYQQTPQKLPTHYYVNHNNTNNNSSSSNNNNNNSNNKPKFNNNNNQYKSNKNHAHTQQMTHTSLRGAPKVNATKKSDILVNDVPPSATSGTTAVPMAVAQTHSNNIVIMPQTETNSQAAPVEVVDAHKSEQPAVAQTEAGVVDGTKSIEAEIKTKTKTKTENTKQEHKIGSKLSNEDTNVSKSSKDKTPMCLVNELARYNKITHQYRLTGERGPAHSKVFTVTLCLGDEEYSADGFKIKKAQHLAASIAIEQTKYKHPPPKTRRSEDGSNGRTHITPTVELNALAMKTGQRTYYLLDPTQIPPEETLVQANEYVMPTQAPQLPPPHVLSTTVAHAAQYIRRNGSYLPAPPPMNVGMAVLPPRYTQRGYPLKYGPRYPMPAQLGAPPHVLNGPHGTFAAVPTTPSKITLFVGKQKFVGIGRTLQQAKHDAAARALQVLKSQPTVPQDENLDDSVDGDGDKKSPISQVHEIGIKRSMTVHFKVLREEGPAHMKNFITACIVGTIVTEGEGNGKKISKKRSAEKMLAELAKLPPMTPTKETPVKRIKVKTPGKVATTTPNVKLERRKRGNALSKEKADADDADNPITKLIQLQQVRKQKEPVFELIAKNGNENSRRREFIFEVTAGGMVARGTGNNKKLAKRNAAQNLLQSLEQAVAAEQITNETNEVNEALTTINESTSNADVPIVSTPAGPVPGILILRQNKKHSSKKKDAASAKTTTTAAETTQKSKTNETAITLTNTTNETIAKTTTTKAQAVENDKNNNASAADSNNKVADSSEKKINNSSSNTNTNNSNSNATANLNVNASNTGNSSGSGGGSVILHMKEQLLYLSKLLGFEVNFSDYPKGNHNEYLTIVTLSTTPPQICHGVGSSSDESQNDAAKNALKMLSELGLNNAKK